jgi:anti-sigma-K factor RskA
MDSQNQQNWQQRLQELDIEVQQAPNENQSQNASTATPSDSSMQLQAKWTQISTWFNQLPTVAKVVVAIIALSVSFSLLKMVFQLVSALIGMAFIGAVLYGVYRFAIAPQSSKS